MTTPTYVNDREAILAALKSLVFADDRIDDDASTVLAAIDEHLARVAPPKPAAVGDPVTGTKYGNTYPWCDVRHDHYVIEVEPKEKSLLRFIGINGDVEVRKRSVAARLRATADEMDPPLSASPSEQSQAMAMLRRLIPIARHEDYCSGGLNEACDCALGDAMELTRDDTPSGPAPKPTEAIDAELEERSRLRRESVARGARFYLPPELRDAQAVSVHLGFGEIISNWRQTLDKRARLTGGDIHRLTAALLSGQASQIKLMYQALVAVKVRSHFIGWANESKWTMPDPKGGSQSISIPDWREELTLVEAALNLADGHTVVTHGEHPAHGEPTLEQIDRNVQARIDAGAVFATEEEALTALNAPVPIQIQCPKCQTWHVDEAEWATRPHRTHQCQSCKHEWRPFEHHTVGVAPTIDQRIAVVMKNQAISDILAGNSTFGDRQAVAALTVEEVAGAALSRLPQVNPTLLALLEANRDLLPLTTGRVHDLKCHPEPFQAMWEKRKTLEFRNDDRRYRVGDIILNREWSPATQTFSGRTLRVLITHKLRGGEFGVPQEYCALSVVPAPAIIARTESTT